MFFRELQRLDSITRSPIFSHFSETLGGLTTIRAFGHQPRFKNLLFSKADAHTNAFLIMNTSNRWLGIALVCILQGSYRRYIPIASRDGITSQTGMCIPTSREGVCGNNAVQFQSCVFRSYCTALGENGCTDIISCQLQEMCSYQISVWLAAPILENCLPNTFHQFWHHQGQLATIVFIMHIGMFFILSGPYTWHNWQWRSAGYSF